MITIDVRTVHLAANQLDEKPAFEQVHHVYVINVTTDHTQWHEEYVDPEHVHAFIRGVKAGALAAGATSGGTLVHVNQPEWNC